MMTPLFALIVLVVFAAPIAAQPSPSIQGVWRVVELTIPASPLDPGDGGSPGASRQDPFSAFGPGTHTHLQPQMMIFTSRHYSRTTDAAVQPRPSTGYRTPGKPTLEELQAQWGPFVANAGTYELAADILTLRAVVAKNPGAQRANNFTRLTVKLEGHSLWLTPIENEAGRISLPVTLKFERVE
jgi:hypothetical protein